jgi:long-chain acyl-CoA synthetase
MTYELDKYTLSETWSKSREAYKDLDFLGYAGEDSESFAQVARNIKRIQSYLKDSGVQVGDKVALISESRPEWGQIYLAVITMGAVCVTIMPDFPKDQTLNILDHSDSVFLFCSDKVLDKIPESAPAKSDKIVLIKDGLRCGKILKDKDSVSFEESGNLLKDDSFKEDDHLYDAEEDDIAAILYTSGTTGNSKGVMLSHKNITHNAYFGIPLCDASVGDSFFSVLPLAHSYECTLGLILPMISGASVHYIKGAPTARIMLPALQKVKPQQMLTVPLLIEKIYRSSIAPKFASKKILKALYSFRPTRFLLNRFVAGKKLKALFGGNLKFFGVGGAPLAPDVEMFLRDAKFPYSVGYGLTETAPLLAGDKPALAVYRAIGKATTDVQLRVVDINPESGDGEIQAMGPNVMLGYYKDKEKTAEVFTEDGWFKTGDLGYLDKNNVLFIKGRLKNMILGPNGENIYPEEIEAILNRDPFVQESLVARMGNTLVGRVQLNTEKLDEFIKNLKGKPEELNRVREETLEKIRQTANSSLNTLSRLGKMVEQKEPFEKTPSMKIKRFLYTSLKKKPEINN